MNQTPKTYPGWLDGPTAEIASLSDLPRQPVNLKPATFLGAQIQQIKTVVQPPVVDSASPLIVTRRVDADGNLQFRVQFIAPTQAQDPNYQTTSISIATANGTKTLSGSGGVGPIVFNAPPSTAPASVVVNQTNSTGSSNTKLGSGSSSKIVQTF